MSSPPLPTLPGVEHRDVRANGVRFHVATAGPPDAPPLVLVHGWPQNWWCWRGVIPLLGDEFRLIVPDLRGHGWSEAPADGYDKVQFGEDVLAVLDELGVERVGWVGHDWGAVAGFLMAAAHPERLTGLMALSVPHPWPSRRDRLDPRRLLALTYQVPLSTPLVGRALVRAGASRQLQRRGIDSRVPDEELAPFEATTRRPEAGRVTQSIYRTFLLRELLTLPGRFAGVRLEVPTRLLMGERDPIAWGASLGGFESHADDMSVEWVPGVGHFLPDERPKLVADRARELFAS